MQNYMKEICQKKYAKPDEGNVAQMSNYIPNSCVRNSVLQKCQFSES